MTLIGQVLLHEFRAEGRKVLCRVGGAGAWAELASVSTHLIDPDRAARNMAAAMQARYPAHFMPGAVQSFTLPT